jgi:hypothetical protein
VTAPDTPDWVASQSSVANQIPLLARAQIQGGNNATGIAVISPFNSIVLTLDTPSILATQVVAVVQFNAAFQVIKEDVISFYDQMNIYPYTCTIPRVGVYAQVFNYSGTGSCFITLAGSNRLLDRPRQDQYFGPRVFTYTGALAVNQRVTMNAADGFGSQSEVICCDVPVALQLYGATDSASTNEQVAGFRFISPGTGALDIFDPALLNSYSVNPGGANGWAVDTNGFPLPLGTVAPVLWNCGTGAQTSRTYTLTVIPRPS